LDIKQAHVKKNTTLWRTCEVLPGALAWTALILPVIFSFIAPSVVAIYILLFDLYWLFRVFYMGWFMRLSYKKMKRALKTDFRAKLEKLPRNNPLIVNWKDIYQVVIFATFREELETLLPSVQ